jgi:alcohol dehydrogenase class IV
VAWVKDVAALGTPPLSRFGMTRADVPGIAAKGLRASSMRGNPVDLTLEEVERILEQGME